MDRAAASFGRMTFHKLLLVPESLRAFRLRSGMSQKALALSMEVDQAALCAVEKGRRGTLPHGAMDKLAKALQLGDGERESLRWQGEHDRLLKELAQGPLSGALELVSAALIAYSRLGSRARAGLVELLRRKGLSGQDVHDLEDLAAGSKTEPKEAAMT